MADSPIWILVPAYKPDSRMYDLARSLRRHEYSVLLVDDGSGPAFASLFDEALSLGCRVERHATNLGKGRALKTGINAILNAAPGLTGVITADADGQHTCADILRIADVMRQNPDCLVTGARVFDQKTPKKSRWGNRITRGVYRFVTGVRCSDTQTGLRGLPARALSEMMKLPGERYEYEMNVLLKLRLLKLALVEVPIETIYVDNNRGSHFHPLRDSFRVYAVILRYLLSSIVSFFVDYSLYLLLLHAFSLPPWLCYATARVVSSTVNYTINRAAVFGKKADRISLLRYYALAAALLVVGSTLVDVLSGLLGGGAGWIKIPVDTLLFLLSYIVQRDYVFR